jgi:hypothetical protein
MSLAHAPDRSAQRSGKAMRTLLHEQAAVQQAAMDALEAKVDRRLDELTALLRGQQTSLRGGGTGGRRYSNSE